jgi:hypothetical protein
MDKVPSEVDVPGKIASFQVHKEISARRQAEEESRIFGRITRNRLGKSPRPPLSKGENEVIADRCRRR